MTNDLTSRENVERFNSGDIMWSLDGNALRHDPKGQWVKYEDYKALREALEKAVAERDEARRRRDAWKAKAEDYDTIRNALREKVGAPWPPNLSRGMWAALAADEKKRADDAEAERDEARARVAAVVEEAVALCNVVDPHDRPKWACAGSWAHCTEIYAMRIRALATNDERNALKDRSDLPPEDTRQVK